MNYSYLHAIFIFSFGTIIGSFLNVIVYRMPRKISVVFPRSHCTNCGKVIRWYENIPIVSYIFLRAKCSECGAAISIKYPLIEFVTGLAAVYFLPSNIDHQSLFHATILFSTFCVFLCQFLIDLEHKLLPDYLNIYLASIFLLYALIHHQWTHWALGGLIGFGFPYLITWGYYLLRGKIGLGGGDIKLYGALGIFLGPFGIVQNIFLSCMLGSLISILLILIKRIDKKDYVPFGPFIIIVAAFQIFFPYYYRIFISYLVP